MRDIKRIPRTLDKIGILWAEFLPDWRLGQIIMVLQSWSGNDLFYVEEEELVEIMIDFLADRARSGDMTRQEIRDLIEGPTTN